MDGRQAVILLSGGLDSSTVLAIAKSQGFECRALSFRYGQRHEIELSRAREMAQRVGVSKHVVVDFDLRQFGVGLDQ
jgi:7-cyano-7-deazaguanine synthase